MRASRLHCLILSFFLATGCASSEGAPALRGPTAGISAEELAEYHHLTAYGAIERLRPSWLPRAVGAVVSDGRRGFDVLRGITADKISSISFSMRRRANIYVRLKRDPS